MDDGDGRAREILYKMPILFQRVLKIFNISACEPQTSDLTPQTPCFSCGSTKRFLADLKNLRVWFNRRLAGTIVLLLMTMVRRC